ncbi:MAG: creatininase family protein, partial [Candidatus Pacebacteria bacterium]|nr:creatininase family protein [Candidatus Paceibacterota bacterium]
GEGWWGNTGMANYYQDHEGGDNPFNWIQGHPLMDAAIIEKYYFDHAAKGETSTMMALCPESVDMNRLDTSKWYLKSAPEASREYGNYGCELVLERLRNLLKPWQT